MARNKQSAYNFFLTHAGYLYDSKTETPMQGRQRCAKSLAYYEKRAQLYGVAFDWNYDEDINSSEWSDEEPPYRTWNCIARDANGKVFASLCGIDFGRDGEPWSEPYRRVVEAELACELPLQADED